MHMGNSSISEAMVIHSSVSKLVLYSWAAFTVLLLATSSILNAWNLLALFTHQRRRQWTSGHVLLAHLYVIDLFCSSVSYTINMANIIFPYWSIWDERMFCQISSFLCTYSAICSSTSICAMSIFRVYTAYHRRLCAVMLQRKVDKFLIFLLLFAHVTSAFAPAWAYIGTEKGEIDPPYDFCGRYPYNGTDTAQIIKMTFWAFVPTVVTAICYGTVHRMLRKECNALPERDPAIGASSDSSRQRAVRRMRVLSHRIIIMSLMKFVVHYPIAIFYLLRTDETSRPLTNLVVLSLHFSSTFFNAILYGLAEPQMKKPYRGLSDGLCITCCE